MITLTAFRQVPDFAKGLVRDLRVRWALEEAGMPYEARLIGFEDLADPAYRALQPFGQVPAIQVSGGAEDGFTLFESGAIVLWIAERCPALMPSDAPALSIALTSFRSAVLADARSFMVC